MNEIKRREVIFLYDVSYANPNGDPNDENKPRIDEETGTNYVTDVRLKRTIRDYLKDYKNQEVFIYEEQTESGRETKTGRLKDKYNSDPRKAMQNCIDLKLFGATFALKGKDKKKDNEDENEEKTEKNLSFTGPVQFRFGKSLHKVKLEYVKGTTVMPSDEKKGAGTFTEKYVLPYALICFYGLVNGKVAEVEGIDLKAQELDLMYEAMWEGTKALFTTSKAQTPRLLIEVVYKDELFHIGDLDKGFKLLTNMEEEAIRGPNDYSLEISDFVNLLAKYKDKIEKIRVRENDLLKLVQGGNPTTLKDALQSVGFTVEDFTF